MKNKNFYIAAGAALVVLLSIFAPAALAGYMDKGIIGKTYEKEDGFYTRSFSYSLTSEEKLFMLSTALAGRQEVSSDFFSSLREKKETASASYSYGPVYEEAGFEIQRAAVMERLSSELNYFVDMDLLPYFDAGAENLYTLSPYAVTDLNSPELSFALWQVSFNKSLPLSYLEQVLLEAYMDAQTGKVYYFTLRVPPEADNFSPDKLAERWAGYLDIPSYTASPDESFPQANKIHGRYQVHVTGYEPFFIDTGYYKGINEYFIKPIS